MSGDDDETCTTVSTQVLTVFYALTSLIRIISRLGASPGFSRLARFKKPDLAPDGTHFTPTYKLAVPR
jgi:hypothetical protein